MKSNLKIKYLFFNKALIDKLCKFNKGKAFTKPLILPKLNDKKIIEKNPKVNAERYYSRVESCRSIISKDKLEKEFQNHLEYKERIKKVKYETECLVKDIKIKILRIKVEKNSDLFISLNYNSNQETKTYYSNITFNISVQNKKNHSLNISILDGN